ncbi:putative AAA family ATPase [Aspergillus clavatus NRRL 1]|uniref:AAA family ATPase, putative n=1 Tax=Aspergillus clavatus (strain ATCC 1007 / CBS 513.65 / DSM 816 / NCTC 3887 / NRRL 1 / QM 1276 / 107) TaxID=344612 RepID=A1CDQ8_ASPCL|nr:AAA family ATPase, putative [Aspergillus clavatus NRRL 1]EAW11985.1 AAA family ATPase, putative [Aspergillus clavatus NRRL 1]
MTTDSDIIPSSSTTSPSLISVPDSPNDPSSGPLTPSTTEAPQRDPSQIKEAQAMPSNNMADPNATSNAGLDTKHEVEPSVDNNAAKTDAKPSVAVPESSALKASCKKHPGKDSDAAGRKRDSKKKAHKSATPEEDTSSESASLSSSSSTNGSDSENDDTVSSSSESDTDKKKRRDRAKGKNKSKKVLKNSRKKKPRSHQQDTSDSESDCDDIDEDDLLNEKTLRRLLTKLQAKKSTKKLRTKGDSSEDPEEDEEETSSDDLAALLAKEMASLSLKLGDGRKTVDGRWSRTRGKRLPDGQTDNRKGHSQRSKGKKKAASKMAFKRVDQLWDNTIHNYKLTETVDDPGANEWDQYIFTVRRKFDWENKYLETVVDIKSKHLRDALAKVMDGVKGVSLVQETAVVDPNMLFLYLEETRSYMKELRQQAKTEKKKRARKLADLKASQLKVLIKYLDTDYAETKKTLYPLLEANMITFDLLWALFKPNTIAYTPTYGNQDEPRAFKIEYATKESSFMKGQWYSIEGRYLEYDGKSFGMGTMAAEVESFKGARKITSLSCYPLKYHREAEEVKTKLIERGKKFVALRGMNYRFHKGMAFYKKKRTVIKVNINGRVMIDPAIHRRINPNYPISTVRPKDPDLMGPSDNEGSDDGCQCGMSDSDEDQQYQDRRDSDAPKVVYKVVQDKEGRPRVVEVELDENGNIMQKEKMDEVQDPSDREFTEEELLIASPVVLGFAFSEKLWLEFSISGISEIDWNEDAFDSLVLPDNQKSIVKALVESHTFRAAQNIDDVIQGKGKGLVAVLHGPPGTGKTLTAEGIAELLKRPLYMVSAGELGTDSRTLEAELNKILDIAHSWGAVLLLDEADIFLEKRTIQDIHRNALVSIFLRLLEYFQGILFLTTNRVETFDDAFQSRIHVALRYGDLTTKAKRSVWKMFLERVQAKEGVQTATFTDKDFDALARHNLNGRQIKNSVRTAQALAVNEQNPLSMEHIKRVLEVAETFDRDLRGGTGYMDAMRSYT